MLGGCCFRGNRRRTNARKPDDGFVYLVVLETSLQFERDGPAAIEDAGFGGSGRSLPSNDNIKASERIWPMTSKIEQVYI